LYSWQHCSSACPHRHPPSLLLAMPATMQVKEVASAATTRSRAAHHKKEAAGRVRVAAPKPAPKAAQKPEAVGRGFTDRGFTDNNLMPAHGRAAHLPAALCTLQWHMEERTKTNHLTGQLTDRPPGGLGKGGRGGQGGGYFVPPRVLRRLPQQQRTTGATGSSTAPAAPTPTSAAAHAVAPAQQPHASTHHTGFHTVRNLQRLHQRSGDQ
jgi:hypothetical protein